MVVGCLPGRDLGTCTFKIRKFNVGQVQDQNSKIPDIDIS